MERRHSVGSASAGFADFNHRGVGVRGRAREPRGSAVNYSRNPRFRPRIVFKIDNIFKEMEQRRVLLTNHALVIFDEGPLAVQSKEEVRNLIMHHFGIRKHELYVYRSHLEPFIVVFSEGHARDLVFVVGRLVDGPIELSFHAWEIDHFGTRDCIPYHVRLCLEGIP
jgi:hypothetical protein